jgi:hypothetical protein
VDHHSSQLNEYKFYQFIFSLELEFTPMKIGGSFLLREKNEKEKNKPFGFLTASPSSVTTCKNQGMS